MATVETVKGPVDVNDLGPTLMHEHVFVMSTEHLQNYGEGDWWDEDARVADAVAKLRALEDKGITTIVDPTVWGIGRYIPRIQRIAEQVDLNIVVATGIYVYEELPHQYAYRGSGLLIDIPEPMVTDFTRDITLGIDRFGLDLFNPTADRVATIAALASRGYSDRMVLSHDASCFMDYFGGAFEQTRAIAAPNWHYEFISDDVLPALREAGVTEAQIQQMLVDNPRRYFTPAAS